MELQVKRVGKREREVQMVDVEIELIKCQQKKGQNSEVEDDLVEWKATHADAGSRETKDCVQFPNLD